MSKAYNGILQTADVNSISKRGAQKLLKSKHLHADSEATNQDGFSLENCLGVREADHCYLSSRSALILEQIGTHTELKDLVGKWPWNPDSLRERVTVEGRH